MGFPLNTKVLTINGWKNIQNIKVGDKLISVDNKETEVIKTFSTMETVYEITVTNKNTFHIGENQFLKVFKNNGAHWNKILKKRENGKKEVCYMMVKEIYDYYNTYKTKISLLNGNPLTYLINKNELPLDPYVFGLLLGDGSFRSNRVSFTTADKELEKIFKDFLYMKNMKYKEYGKETSQSKDIIVSNLDVKIKNFLLDECLWNKTSFEKHIPNIYKYSSIENRIALLQGLMDTDGYISYKDRNMEYTTVSAILAEDVKYIIESLGGRCTICERPSMYSTNHKKVILNHPNYKLSINFRGNDSYLNFIPFRLSRKKERYTRFKNQIKKSTLIQSILKKEAKECINIITDDKNFIINNFIGVYNE